ncbi:MAG: hypothetical protein JKX68_05740 [Flavobacteriales bacterium]|nr:hypothetical protein [Flavobacteriales bacterium]
MNVKIFISIILLLTYSFGFAHNFIPHSHDSETEKHEITHEKDGHNHHQHNNTTKHLNSDHEHISHGDHYDESLYELLVCFMHEAHQGDDCKDQHFTIAKPNRILANKLQINKLVATLFSIALEYENELVTYYQVSSNIAYLSQSIEVPSLRGPPAIS